VRGIGAIWLAAIVLAAGAAGARGQEAAGYEPLRLPQGWSEFREKDGDVERVEYIYQDRLDGLLRVKRVSLASGETPETVAARDTDGPLRFLPDYDFLKREAFGGGNHAGVLVEYNFVHRGKPAMGRSYYLKGTGPTVWVLQFTGKRDVLRPMRNVTDHMARDFRER
jgi:hypothetical protein